MVTLVLGRKKIISRGACSCSSLSSGCSGLGCDLPVSVVCGRGEGNEVRLVSRSVFGFDRLRLLQAVCVCVCQFSRVHSESSGFDGVWGEGGAEGNDVRLV